VGGAGDIDRLGDGEVEALEAVLHLAVFGEFI
jgi:hypothetical protein